MTREITRLKQSLAGYITQHTRPSLARGTGSCLTAEDRIAITTWANRYIDTAYRMGYQAGLAAHQAESQQKARSARGAAE